MKEAVRSVRVLTSAQAPVAFLAQDASVAVINKRIPTEKKFLS